ncbi:hypothetical protein M2322_002653 [Rhodoblastus acidophilus]|uniref:hypothetical protein n=1 Tax=Rhodoblastus acidophilus TaxID=1074 RepID=UPI0022245420|nr:hypothetical protein [Rhodoblastus acidophilus]MCW2317099.1 hypothetical protein [Rhodoblastus acidophilus]
MATVKKNTASTTKTTRKAPAAATPAPAGDDESKQQQEAAAEVTAPVTLGSRGKFTFEMEELPELPPEALQPARATSAVELPFKEWFPKMKHNGHIFLPRAFWTASKEDGGRNVPEDKATVGYARAKINGSFNEWKKKAAPEDGFERSLILIPRKAGEDNGRFKEDGISIFMQITKKAEQEPEPEQPQQED